MKKRNTGEVILAFFTGGTRRDAGLRCRITARFTLTPISYAVQEYYITKRQPAVAKGTTPARGAGGC